MYVYINAPAMTNFPSGEYLERIWYSPQVWPTKHANQKRKSAHLNHNPLESTTNSPVERPKQTKAS